MIREVQYHDSNLSASKSQNQDALAFWRGAPLNEDVPEPLLLLHRIKERSAEAGDPTRAVKNECCNW